MALDIRHMDYVHEDYDTMSTVISARPGPLRGA